jgi:hypothetical protein
VPWTGTYGCGPGVLWHAVLSYGSGRTGAGHCDHGVNGTLISVTVTVRLVVGETGRPRRPAELVSVVLIGVVPARCPAGRAAVSRCPARRP